MLRWLNLSIKIATVLAVPVVLLWVLFPTGPWDSEILLVQIALSVFSLPASILLMHRGFALVKRHFVYLEWERQTPRRSDLVWLLVAFTLFLLAFVGIVLRMTPPFWFLHGLAPTCMLNYFWLVCFSRKFTSFYFLNKNPSPPNQKQQEELNAYGSILGYRVRSHAT